MGQDRARAVNRLYLTPAETGRFPAVGVGPGRLREDMDPVPTADEAMQQVCERWAPKGYDVGEAGGKCCAMHLISGDVLTADTPDGLDSAIRAYEYWTTLEAGGARS